MSQRSTDDRPLPSPAVVPERFTGVSKLRPPSVERAKKISPPWDPPENTISCHSTYTRHGSPTRIATLGSHEKVSGLLDTLTGMSNTASPAAS